MASFEWTIGKVYKRQNGGGTLKLVKDLGEDQTYRYVLRSTKTRYNVVVNSEGLDPTEREIVRVTRSKRRTPMERLWARVKRIEEQLGIEVDENLDVINKPWNDETQEQH